MPRGLGTITAAKRFGWLFIRPTSTLRSIRAHTGDYPRFLWVPWKLATFSIAAIGLIIIAPYTGDPTGDHSDAAFMSVLTFLTAPWAVGVLVKTLRRQLPVHQALVAACVWFFSASWSYDGYLLIRDGAYPVTWLVNLLASSVLYVSGGLFWSLDWRSDRGVLFAFVEADWPQAPSGPVFNRILWLASTFMVLVALMLLPFLWPQLP